VIAADEPAGASGRRVRGPGGPGRTDTAGGRRREVLALLRESAAPLSIAEIAQRLQVHPNTVRFHLEALADAGQAERVTAAPAGPGRPPLRFRARPGMDPAGPRNYRLLAAVLAGSLATAPDPAAAAADAGRRSGAQLADRAAIGPDPSPEAAITWLVELLDGLGFAPEWPMPDDGERIGLRHCPFLEIVDVEPGVVCPVHLGLMQGAMSALDAPVTVERLEPFAAPDLCLAHLSAPAPGRRKASR
jgi:predicted ArsR family transcriptional regulator